MTRAEKCYTDDYFYQFAQAESHGQYEQTIVT